MKDTNMGLTNLIFVMMKTLSFLDENLVIRVRLWEVCKRSQMHDNIISYGICFGTDQSLFYLALEDIVTCNRRASACASSQKLAMQQPAWQQPDSIACGAVRRSMRGVICCAACKVTPLHSPHTPSLLLLPLHLSFVSPTPLKAIATHLSNITWLNP